MRKLKEADLSSVLDICFLLLIVHRWSPNFLCTALFCFQNSNQVYNSTKDRWWYQVNKYNTWKSFYQLWLFWFLSHGLNLKNVLVVKFISHSFQILSTKKLYKAFWWRFFKIHLFITIEWEIRSLSRNFIFKFGFKKKWRFYMASEQIYMFVVFWFAFKI